MEENKKIYQEFLEVSKQIGVPVKKIFDMFWYLLNDTAIDNNRLVQMVGVSKNALNQIKKALAIYLNPPSFETSLKKGAAEKLKKIYDKNYSVEEDLLTILVKNDIYKQSLDLLSHFRNNRPIPKRNYDQFIATPETSAKRAALLNFLGDVEGKRILFLGDDDFTSVVTANLKSAKEIVAIDIDEEIINSLSLISNELDLKIKAIKHDLRKPILTELKSKFDTVFIDPPYTPDGIKLFVSRAIEAIDQKNQTARIYVCYGSSDRAKERFLPIQEIFTNSGLMLRWVFDRFNRYNGGEAIGSSSSLYITELTPKVKPLIKGNYDKPIYTNN